MLTILLAVACSTTNGRGVPGEGKAVAVVDVTVVPMDSERSLPHHTVLIREGVISEVAPAASISVPADAQRINGTGRYLSPGLTDAHVHLRDTSELLSYLAYGVTTVVHLSGPAGNVGDVLDLRARVARGDLLGPTILTSGRILDGSSPVFAGVSTVIETPEEASRVVEDQIDAGVDFIKVYNNLRADALRAVVKTAHSRGVSVWGHIPRIDGRHTALQSALAAGLDVIAHGEELFFTFLHRDVERQLDRGLVPVASSAMIGESARLVQEAGVAVIPNLSFVAMTRAQLDDINRLMKDPEARFLTPAVRDMWAQQNPTQRRDLPRFDLRERGKAAVLKTVTRALNEAGVPLLLGTDAAAPGMYPGKSAHTELEELVDAGLTPYEALASATRNAGGIIGKERPGGASFGTVTVGSRADLLILEGHPLADVGNVAAIVGVFLRGEWFTRAELDSMRVRGIS
ncbi:MAG: amidohydrolase family protein [Gemmatimonadales bacterium]